MISISYYSLFTTPCSLLPAPCSLLPAPCSLLPAPCSLFPVPCSLKTRRKVSKQIDNCFKMLYYSNVFKKKSKTQN
ncbi:hypothetical protein [Moorena producens]|uniref:hypothetical protein n=1 Tax=Moorena producens TaxID=1155739 RepID=UPI003C74EC4B